MKVVIMVSTDAIDREGRAYLVGGRKLNFLKLELVNVMISSFGSVEW